MPHLLHLTHLGEKPVAPDIESIALLAFRAGSPTHQISGFEEDRAVMITPLLKLIGCRQPGRDLGLTRRHSPTPDAPTPSSAQEELGVGSRCVNLVKYRQLINLLSESGALAIGERNRSA